MEKIDECRHCSLRGNLDECLKTPCSKHNMWLVEALRERHTKEIDDQKTMAKLGFAVFCFGMAAVLFLSSIL